VNEEIDMAYYGNSYYDETPEDHYVSDYITSYDGGQEYIYKPYTAKEVYEIANTEARAARRGRANLPTCAGDCAYNTADSIREYIAFEYEINVMGRFAEVINAALLAAGFE
jgi:hypothetical protein